MDKEIIDKINEFANQARVFFKFEKVVVYGSFANNTNHADSDIDLAFFVNEAIPNHWDLSSKFFELAEKIDVRIKPVILNEKTDRSGFAKNILKNGIVIC